MRSRQFEFGKTTEKKLVFGGSRLKGNAREKRPFHKHMHTHLVMRSSLAVGEKSLLKRSNKDLVEGIVRRAGHVFSVKIHRYVNVGNHLHLAIKAPNREAQANFLRTISGCIARLIMKAEKGRPGRYEKFWDSKPFTKLVSFGRQFNSLMNYLTLNSLEAIGFSKVAGRAYLKAFSTG